MGRDGENIGRGGNLLILSHHTYEEQTEITTIGLLEKYCFLYPDKLCP